MKLQKSKQFYLQRVCLKNTWALSLQLPSQLPKYFCQWLLPSFSLMHPILPQPPWGQNAQNMFCLRAIFKNIIILINDVNNNNTNNTKKRIKLAIKEKKMKQNPYTSMQSEKLKGLKALYFLWLGSQHYITHHKVIYTYPVHIIMKPSDGKIGIIIIFSYFCRILRKESNYLILKPQPKQ